MSRVEAGAPGGFEPRVGRVRAWWIARRAARHIDTEWAIAHEREDDETEEERD